MAVTPDSRRTTSPAPIYRRPKRGHSLLWGLVGTLVVVVLVAAGVLAYAMLRSSGGPAPTRTQLQATVLASAQKRIKASSVSCVMPSSWASGQTFSCFAYDAKGTEVGQMKGTVLPADGQTWEANETWSFTSAATSATTTTVTTTTATAVTGCADLSPLIAAASGSDGPQGFGSWMATSPTWHAIVQLETVGGDYAPIATAASALVHVAYGFLTGTATLTTVQVRVTALRTACAATGLQT